MYLQNKQTACLGPIVVVVVIFLSPFRILLLLLFSKLFLKKRATAFRIICFINFRFFSKSLIPWRHENSLNADLAMTRPLCWCAFRRRVFWTPAFYFVFMLYSSSGRCDAAARAILTRKFIFPFTPFFLASSAKGSLADRVTQSSLLFKADPRGLFAVQFIKQKTQSRISFSRGFVADALNESRKFPLSKSN